MDVWFCRVQEPMPRGIPCALNTLEAVIGTLSRACPGHPCLHLTNDYMDVGKAETILPNDDPNLASNCMKNGVLTKFKRAEPAGW